KPSEPWPHLLLEQDIEPFVRVGDVDTIRVKGRFELLGFTDYMDEAAEEHHTAQFVWVMVFRNVNERSSDFGRFMWVVMGIFDSRYEVMPLYCAQDNAMPDGEFIYSFSSADYLDGRLKTGVPQDVDFDVYPRLKEIFARARSAGYLTHTAFEDLALTGMNFGFEITGTFSAAISVKQPELIVKEK
ncbi:MAG: hypothetical protein IJR61_00705, partial [Clostridia bacterium]|nr:hypothetical protein [Clostridia bacterium]